MEPIVRIASTLPQGDCYAVNRRGLVALGRGEPVVLLHASAHSKWQWTALAQRLASHFQAIALDLHGHGDHRASPAPPEFSVDDEIDLVQSGLDAVLGCNVPVHVVGHSYGGLVALQFALRHPHLVKSLSLYEPLVLSLLSEANAIGDSVRAMSNALSECVTRHSHFEAAQIFFDFWHGEGAFANLSLAGKTRLASSAGQIALNIQAALESPVSLESVRALHARVFLVSGARSHLFARHIVDVLFRTLSSARFNWINGDHMAPINAPELVYPWIETFLQTATGLSR
jgi:pimeloyl-ACP methyl ester carboxylesterase